LPGSLPLFIYKSPAERVARFPNLYSRHRDKQ
jgi:hypothetical protein